MTSKKRLLGLLLLTSGLLPLSANAEIKIIIGTPSYHYKQAPVYYQPYYHHHHNYRQQQTHAFGGYDGHKDERRNNHFAYSRERDKLKHAYWNGYHDGRQDSYRYDRRYSYR